MADDMFYKISLPIAGKEYRCSPRDQRPGPRQLAKFLSASAWALPALEKCKTHFEKRGRSPDTETPSHDNRIHHGTRRALTSRRPGKWSHGQGACRGDPSGFSRRIPI